MKQFHKTSAVKSLVAALAIAGTALSPVAATSASADGWNRGDSVRHLKRGGCVWSHGRKVCGPRGFPRRDHRRHDGDAAAAAILGLAGVAIIAGALSKPNPPVVYETYPAPNPYPPAPSRPNVITYESTLEPWTRGWYEWCDDHYRSFNPETGTFRGYDGRDHFCVPK